MQERGHSSQIVDSTLVGMEDRGHAMPLILRDTFYQETRL